MQSTITESEWRERVVRRFSPRAWLTDQSLRRSVPFVYLAGALPVALVLCFLIAPMQAPDESRHFLRACQFAQGQILPEIDPNTHKAGGLLPAAAVDFVRDKMNPEYYRNEDRLHSIAARLRALNAAAQHQAPLSQQEFGVFPGSAIYFPALYLPQTVGIRLARLFTYKVYLWFYAARVANAVTAIGLIFLALLLARGYRLVLLIPAILPMSLYQISSVSSDAEFISVSILFVALSIRFVGSDGRALRGALIACLFLLTLGKPVYLPFALLLLPAYKRLGWRRAILFCAGVIAFCSCAYVAWSYFVRPIFAMAARDFESRNPSAQVGYILTHPVGFLIALRHTVIWDSSTMIRSMIGDFGWVGMPLPLWFYHLTYGFFAIILLCLFLNWKQIRISKFLSGGFAAAGALLAIALAGYVLWCPVGSNVIGQLQGRYFIPVLAILAFFFPAMDRIGRRSRRGLAVLVLGFFALSAFTTVRTVKHYFFPQAALDGQNVYALFRDVSGQSCPASAGPSVTLGWVSTVGRGTARVDGRFRVLLANKNGTILGESDPALTGSEFPYDLLPGASHSKWLVHIWTVNRQPTTLRYWLIRGNTACTFGPVINLKPYQIPSA